MTGDEIKALRRTLDLTARKLGETLGVDQATVLAWEREELFPTKRYVEAMRVLAKKGEAGETTGTGGAAAETGATIEKGPTIEKKEEIDAGGRAERAPLRALADPEVWRLFRKIVAHPELRAEVEELAGKFVDPAED